MSNSGPVCLIKPKFTSSHPRFTGMEAAWSQPPTEIQSPPRITFKNNKEKRTKQNSKQCPVGRMRSSWRHSNFTGVTVRTAEGQTKVTVRWRTRSNTSEALRRTDQKGLGRYQSRKGGRGQNPTSKQIRKGQARVKSRKKTK